MRKADAIRQAFAPLLGQPVRKARKGHGSFLTFDFQSPPSEESEYHAARADNWHLWIYCCHWRLVIGDQIAADSAAAGDDIARAAESLMGYRLLDVSSDPAFGTSFFRFDGGISLETWPYPTDSAELWASDQEQWLLYAPGSRVFTYTADGHSRWQASDEN